MNKHIIHSSQMINKIINSVVLQADYLSDYGLDVCVAITAPKCVQLWSSKTWKTDLKDAMRAAANTQADLEVENINVNMFLEINSASQGANYFNRSDQGAHYVNQSDRTAATDQPGTYTEAQETDYDSFQLIDEVDIKSEPKIIDWTMNEENVNQDIVDDTIVDDTTGATHEGMELRVTNVTEVKSESDTERVPAAPGESYLKEHSEQTLIAKDVIHNNNDGQNLVLKNTGTATPTSTRERRCKTERTYAETGYECHECDYKTSRLRQLQQHMVQHGMERRLKCSKCNFMTNFAGHFARHLKSHAGATNFTCSVCNYKATYSQGLIAHIKIHANNESYTNCKYCDFITTEKKKLHLHMRTHVFSKRELSCEFCSYETSSAYCLKSHMRTHTGEKPYQCKLCDYKAAHSNSLRMHMKKNHTSE